MQPQLNVLPDQQLALLQAMGPEARKRGFYLGGGTGVALYFGHRQSHDLDWFHEQPFDPAELAAELNAAGIEMESSYFEKSTLHGTARGVKVSFLHYKYPPLEPLETCPDLDCVFAATSDLAAMKLLAVTQRGARKDFIDIYALGTQVHSLTEMLEFYRRKFSVTDIQRVLYALAFFDDAEIEPMPRMIWNDDWTKIRATILDWIRNVSK